MTVPYRCYHMKIYTDNFSWFSFNTSTWENYKYFIHVFNRSVNVQNDCDITWHGRITSSSLSFLCEWVQSVLSVIKQIIILTTLSIICLCWSVRVWVDPPSEYLQNVKVIYCENCKILGPRLFVILLIFWLCNVNNQI